MAPHSWEAEASIEVPGWARLERWQPEEGRSASWRWCLGRPPSSFPLLKSLPHMTPPFTNHAPPNTPPRSRNRMKRTEVQGEGCVRELGCRSRCMVGQVQSHRHSDKCRDRDWKREGGGERNRQRPMQESRNAGDTGTETLLVWPACGSEPLQPWLDRSGPGLGGGLQEGFAPGSLGFRFEVLLHLGGRPNCRPRTSHL